MIGFPLYIHTIIAEVELLVPHAVEKLLIGLEDTYGQAVRVEFDLCDNCLNAPSNLDDSDDGEFMAGADMRAQAMYESLASLRQAAINLLAVWLFDLFELRRAEYRSEARERGERELDFESLPGWERVALLGRVAKTVKYGEDRDGALRAGASELFLAPRLIQLPYSTARGTRLPLGGDGPFVTLDQLHEFAADVVRLWRRVQMVHSTPGPA